MEEIWTEVLKMTIRWKTAQNTHADAQNTHAVE